MFLYDLAYAQGLLTPFDSKSDDLYSPFAFYFIFRFVGLKIISFLCKHFLFIYALLSILCTPRITFLKVTFVCLCIISGVVEGVAQSVVIGGGPGSGNALLEITSTDKGLLIPRMSSAQRTAISGPANGLLVYDTDRHSFYTYNGRTGWVEMKPVASGTIAMWYGDVATYFPGGTGVGHMKGWAVCNGANNTPNLGGTFLMGGEMGATGGGAETVSLDAGQIPSHTHAVSDPGHGHVASLAANTSHSHVVSYSNSGTSAAYASADDGPNYTYSGDGTVSYEVTTNDAAFSSTINPAATGITTQSNGSGQPHENRPPFYVLVYIKKL